MDAVSRRMAGDGWGERWGWGFGRTAEIKRAARQRSLTFDFKIKKEEE